MQYSIQADVIEFLMENPKREKFKRSYVSRSDVSLTFEEQVVVCDAVVRQIRGRQCSSQRVVINVFMRPFFKYFSTTNVPLPKFTDEWQVLLLDFFQVYLTDSTFSNCSAKTRMKNWNRCVRGVFEFWKDEEIVPYDVLIPTITIKYEHKVPSDQYILGASQSHLAIEPTNQQKIVVNIDFGQNDFDYLEKIELACRNTVGVIKKVCQEHWDALVCDWDTGKKFASSVPISEIEQVLLDRQFIPIFNRGQGTRLCSHTQPDGHIWGVAVVKQWLNSGKDQNCVSLSKICASVLFPQKIFSKSGYDLSPYSALPLHTDYQIPGFAQFYRFVGVLSALDVAVVCCLLTIEHPEFTSESLQNAKLLNARGKSHLLLTDNNNSFIFSIDKPRAGQRKTVALTDTAQKLVKEVLELTKSVRKVLKAAGDKGWRFLFLGYNRGGRLGPIDAPVRHLNGTDTYSLTRLYPELSEVGLAAGTFDYRRIRTTMGVIRWFETGSVQEMSRRLGNTTRVVIEHYLPPALLRAWNTRIIRRFQNMLIVLAAYAEDYLLDVTDFSSFSDLQDFVAQLLFEYPGTTSPLAKELHRRMGQGFDSHKLKVDFDAILNIRLSEVSLGYLYAFSDFATNNLTFEELGHVDLRSNLSPIQFVDLARLIQHACENESVAFQLRELLDLPKLKIIHGYALAKKAEIEARLTNLSIARRWEE